MCMYLVGKPTECTVVLSNTDLRVYRENCPKDVEKLDMKNCSATKHFTEVAMLGASSCTRPAKVGYFHSRMCEVITIKSSIGLLHWRGFRVDLFFDALCENEELPAWKKCIEEAIDNSETQLNPLMLARQQIGLCHKKLHLRRHRSRSLGPQRKRCAQLVPLHAKTVWYFNP